jgi:hypothetical protein
MRNVSPYALKELLPLAESLLPSLPDRGTYLAFVDALEEAGLDPDLVSTLRREDGELYAVRGGGFDDVGEPFYPGPTYVYYRLAPPSSIYDAYGIGQCLTASATFGRVNGTPRKPYEPPYSVLLIKTPLVIPCSRGGCSYEILSPFVGGRRSAYRWVCEKCLSEDRDLTERLGKEDYDRLYPDFPVEEEREREKRNAS